MESKQAADLERRLNSAQGVDRVDILNALAWLLSTTNPDRAAFLAQEALALSCIGDDPQGFYKKGKALSLRTLGCLAMLRNQYAEALKVLLEARVLLEELPDMDCQDGLGTVLSYLGWVFFNYGDFPLAIETLHGAEQMARKIGNRRLQAEILNSLGMVYNESGSLDQAVETLQRSLLLLEDSDELRTHCVTHNNLAMTQLKQHDHGSALDNSMESMSIAAQLEAADLMAGILDTTGQIYLDMQDYTRAEEYFHRALDIHQGFGSDVNEFSLSLARALIGQGRLGRAAQVLHQSLETIEACGISRFTYQFHQLLSSICEMQGDFSRALFHYKRFHALESQVLNESTRHRLDVLTVVHQAETARLDGEILRLRNMVLQQELRTTRQALSKMQARP
jgi:tetratricopeptide (TPR) repeat protein